MSEVHPTKDKGDIRNLIADALPMIQSARDELYRSFQIDGEVYDVSAKKDIRKFDRWIKKAVKVVAP